MRILWVIVGGGVGLVVGAIVGFGMAMVLMSFSPKHNDGTDGMREVLVCLPTGALAGLIAGIWWGLRTTLMMP